MEWTRRDLLKVAAALVVERWASTQRYAFAKDTGGAARKVIVVACGGMRRQETFDAHGYTNIPHLAGRLAPQGVFFNSVRNAGVTSHYNTISSIVTGNWQRLDDWGKQRPASPTIFEMARRAMHLPADSTWVISSNKALTSQIGASAQRDFGPAYGANVVFPKQLLINAVVRAAAQGRAVKGNERGSVEPELMAMLSHDNYDGLGWSISGDDVSDETPALGAIHEAIDDLIRTNAPVTGDEFTFLVSAEVMRRFAPRLLVLTFSDMEVAHFGSYSLHVAGVRTVDRLVGELWDLVQTTPAYKDQTTMFVLPEFGRDLDGSTTNGFFNHRQDNESTRNTWMLCLGEAVRKPQIVESPTGHTDLCPTIAKLFEMNLGGSLGHVLPGLWL